MAGLFSIAARFSSSPALNFHRTSYGGGAIGSPTPRRGPPPWKAGNEAGASAARAGAAADTTISSSAETILIARPRHGQRTTDETLLRRHIVGDQFVLRLDEQLALVNQ